LLILFSFMLTAGGALVAWLAASGQLDVLGKLGRMFEQAFNNEQLRWDPVAVMPIPVTIGERPAVIGRLRSQPGDLLHIGAFDLETGNELWRVSDLGTYAEGYQNTFAAVDGGKVAISDWKGRVRIADLATGTLEREVKLTDRPQLLCKAAGGGVFVDVVDDRHLKIDLATGKTEPASRPVGCPDHWSRQEPGVREEADRAPTVEGFAPKRVLRVGGTAVAAGVKSPGTPVPQAVGFDARSGRVLWRGVVPAVDPNTVQAQFENDDLGFGKYVAAYMEGSEQWHVTALDAKTGTRLWDVKLRPVFAVDSIKVLLVTSRYVLIARMGSLDVLDAKTGKHVTTIGKETYDDQMNN
jgi:outer membrane protein assembly factor BamB